MNYESHNSSSNPSDEIADIEQNKIKNESAISNSDLSTGQINSGNGLESDHFAPEVKKHQTYSSKGQKYGVMNKRLSDTNESQNEKSNGENQLNNPKDKKEIRPKFAKSSPSRNFVGLYNNNNNQNDDFEKENYLENYEYSRAKSFLWKTVKSPLGPGKVGLENIGNTCFFNSGVQCLSHLMNLVNYFEFSDWKRELNTQNPLGMHGDIAVAFANLIHRIWKGEILAFSPFELKSIIGEFEPQFSGNDQQDAHELITFLLDGIHEDLNRCVNKPIVESVIGNGMNDIETAEKAWYTHKLRNDSIIVDIFHGQLRSKLNCPICKSITTVFDPYVTLSMPLMSLQKKKEKSQKKLKITYIPQDFSSKYKFFTLDIKGNENVYDVSGMIRDKVKTSKSIIIGRFDETSNEFNWGLSHSETGKKSKKNNNNNSSDDFSDNFDVNISNHHNSIFDSKSNEKDENFDDDTGEYLAFEITDADYPQYWIPCFLKMKVKNFLSSTEKSVVGPFLLPSVDEFPTEKELSDICESVISSIWEEYPESEPTSENRDNPSDTDSELQSKTFSNIILPDLSFGDSSRVKVTKDVEIFYDEHFTFLSNNYVTARLSLEAVKDPNFSKKRLLINTNPRNFSPLSFGSNFSGLQDEKIELEKCFEYFSMNETLDETNQWFCPHCRQFVCAQKKMDIWSVPKDLILQLKRFDTEESSFGSIASKVTTKVEYPLVLNMDKYIVGPHKKSSTVYRLRAVSEHIGTAVGGHYTSLALVDEEYGVKRMKGKGAGEIANWYLFNDASVTKVSTKDAFSDDAYILFYERVSDGEDDDESGEANEYYERSENEEEEEEEEEGGDDDDDDESADDKGRASSQSNNEDDAEVESMQRDDNSANGNSEDAESANFRVYESKTVSNDGDQEPSSASASKDFESNGFSDADAKYDSNQRDSGSSIYNAGFANGRDSGSSVFNAELSNGRDSESSAFSAEFANGKDFVESKKVKISNGRGDVYESASVSVFNRSGEAVETANFEVYSHNGESVRFNGNEESAANKGKVEAEAEEEEEEAEADENVNAENEEGKAKSPNVQNVQEKNEGKIAEEILNSEFPFIQEKPKKTDGFRMSRSSDVEAYDDEDESQCNIS